MRNRLIWEAGGIHLPYRHTYTKIVRFVGWELRERNEEGKINFSFIVTCWFLLFFLLHICLMFIWMICYLWLCKKWQNFVDCRNKKILWGKYLAYKWDLIKIHRLHCHKLSRVEPLVAWLFSPSCDWSMSTSRHSYQSRRMYSYFLNELEGA